MGPCWGHDKFAMTLFTLALVFSCSIILFKLFLGPSCIVNSKIKGLGLLKCLDYFPFLYDCNTDGKRDLRNYDNDSSLMCLGIVPPVY